MSKGKSIGLLDDVLSRVKDNRGPTWFQRLPTDLQDEVTAIRTQFREGSLTFTAGQLAVAIMEACRARGHEMPKPRQVREWLLEVHR